MRCGLLLKWHVDWAEASRRVSQQSATWLYALTARLQRPLTQVRSVSKLPVVRAPQARSAPSALLPSAHASSAELVICLYSKWIS